MLQANINGPMAATVANARPVIEKRGGRITNGSMVPVLVENAKLVGRMRIFVITNGHHF